MNLENIKEYMHLKSFKGGSKIIIAAGSVSRELPFTPFNGKVIMNSDMMLENAKLAETLLIIGGGTIGCEFATYIVPS
jgi:dihydrolipoamide dehydrogenase